MKLEATQRLKAWTVNPSTKDSLWRDYRKRGEFDFKDIQDHSKHIGQVHGFDLYHAEDHDTYFLVDGEVVALMFLYLPTNKADSIQENVILVNPEYQGQGLAFVFYEWLLHHYRALESDTSFSAGAAKMWMRLIQKYEGHIKVPVKGRFIKVDIQGFGEHKGTFWPIVYFGGQLVNLGERRDRATGAEKKAINDFRYVVYR